MLILPTTNPSDTKVWTTLWTKARAGDNACPRWEVLSKSQKFPLRDAAEAAWLLLCKNPNWNKDVAQKLGQQFPDWSLELIQSNKEKTNPIFQLYFQWKSAKNRKNQEAALKELILSAEKEATSFQSELAEWRRLLPQPETMDWRKQSQYYRELLDYKKAIQILKKTLPQLSGYDKLEALQSLRQIYKLAEQKQDMLKISRQWSGQAKKLFAKNFLAPTKYQEIQLNHARGLWTEENKKEAESVLQMLRKDLQRKTSVAEVTYILGRMSEEGKEYSRALDYYKQAQLQNPSPLLLEKILWSEAWLQYKNAHYQIAQKLLSTLAARTTEPGTRARSLFWQARALKQLKNSESEKIYAQVIDEDVIGFYGLMAQKDLHQNLQPIEPPSFLDSKVELKVASALEAQLIWSLNLKEPALIQKFANELLNSPLISQLSPDHLSLVAQSGLYLPLFIYLGKASTSDKKNWLMTQPQLIFPMTVRHELEELVKNYTFSASLPLSIIRQESAFNPWARSPADAIGLMQLLPTVAKVTAEELYNPQLNLQIGTQELDRLLKRWKNQYILAIASYNASEKAVKGWLKTRYRQDPLEFIEEIPYEETRGYIKLVLRNYFFYERLTHKENLIWNDDIFKLQKNFK